ncbi:MAG: hypothetical protein R3E01_14940 [Pirellulaceae bacterium]
MSVTSADNLSRTAETAPECLRQLPQWVAWKYVTRDGKPTKAPVNARTGALADSTDAGTWSTFDEALVACRQDQSLAGLGFVFAEGDPYCGVDLDDCIDPDRGELKPWATSIVERLDSYTEISPSGTGVKVFVEAVKTGDRCRKAYHDGEVEMYDRARFFTVTGERLDQCPPGINARQPAIDDLYVEVFGAENTRASPPGPQPSANGHVHLDDDQIIELASNQRRSGAKFRALWSGDWNAHFNSASEADSSVVFTLAFYTKDAGQIDRLFRRSGLMRPKWDEQHGAETYGQMTVGKALGKVTKQYQPKGKRRRPSAPPPTNPELPSIVIDDRQLSDLTGQALAAVKRSNKPPSVFVRAGAVARVLRDENGVPKIEQFDRVRMRCRLSEVANFFTLRKGDGGCYEQVGVPPPLSLAENILAQTSWELPPLAGIARAPILRTDGSICTTPGYDPVSRLMYCPDPELELTPIPEFPDGNEVQACVDLLLEVISDFPFADEASRANALAILFTLLMRPVISGHVPLAIVDAPMQGTGKTLLVTALGTIAVGAVSSESIPSKENDDEWRKKITSILLAASPFVLLDNIPDNTTIDSPSLAAALTTEEWSDRLLGRNNAIRLPSRVVWAATGNNLRVAGDMPRRSYSIRLDANAERPWERTGFKIKGLERHVRSRRGDLLSAALTIVRAWYTNGQPKADVPTLGSFDEWAETVGSVIAFAGIDGFLANLEQTQVVQDEDAQQWSAFFEAWWDTFRGAGVIADDLCKRLIEDDVHDGAARAVPDVLLVHLDVHGARAGALRKALGRHLSRLKGRIFNGHKLLDAGSDPHRKVRVWRLADATNPAQPRVTPQNSSPNPAQQGLW